MVEEIARPNPVPSPGFFVVQNSNGQPFLTRAGSFVPDGEGRLVNAAGFQLMGYNYENGIPSTVANGFAGLEPVQISGQELQATLACAARVRPARRRAGEEADARVSQHMRTTAMRRESSSGSSLARRAISLSSRQRAPRRGARTRPQGATHE